MCGLSEASAEIGSSVSVSLACNSPLGGAVGSSNGPRTSVNSSIRCFRLSLLHADSRAVRQSDFAVDNGCADERVVLDQDGAIEIGPVHQRRELGGGGNCTTRFRHAAEHHFQSHGSREENYLMR